MVTPRLPAILTATALLSCGNAAAPDRCADGRCDEQDTSALDCDAVLVDSSGQGRSQGELLDALSDRFIDSVYRPGTRCPVKLDAIAPLVAAGTSGTRCQVQTRVISEQAQLRGSAAGSAYRAVTSCNGEGEVVDALFATFGYHGSGSADPLHIDGSGTPDAFGGGAGGVEIIAFDDTAGVFNFYKEVGRQMHFFGNSIDLATRGPAGPSILDERGCGNCHTGGGPIMKELVSPWLHWEFSNRSPGAEALVDNRTSFLGKRELALGLEVEVIEPALRRWNATRYRHLFEHGTIADLLAPLFCPVEINIESNSKADDTPLLIPGKFFASDRIPRRIGILDGFEMPAAQYAAIRAAIDQRVAGVGNGPDGRPFRDTVETFTFITRSFADEQFVELMQTGIPGVVPAVVDPELVVDVMLVDMTRPVFSTDRCDLLASLPDRPAASLGDDPPDALRALFLDVLADSPPSSPGAQLRDALAGALSSDREQVFDNFRRACASRQQTEMVKLPSGDSVSGFHIDVMRLRSLQRKIAFARDGFEPVTSRVKLPGGRPVVGPMPVFEFAATMATDAVVPSPDAAPSSLTSVHPQARLDPLDCSLATGFVRLP